ncbi:MAG TPA: tetratricopeptide repeat protein [Armatimonadota bacterium]|jgi:tetratricopeptide (TPR) repeat protein
MSVIECAQCGAVVGEGQEYCAACGSAVAGQEALLIHDEVHRLLAEANLLRIRRQCDEAVSMCTRVLRLDPANATAHSLMGDIYRDERNYREALGWFKLAVQLDPHNTADRRKLDEMIDRVFQSTVQDGGVENPELAVLPARAGGIGVRVRALLAKLTPTHVVISATVLAVIAMLVIVLVTAPKTNTPLQPGTTPVATANPTGTPTAPVLPPAPGVTTPGSTPSSPQVIPPAPDTVEGGTTVPGLPHIVVQPSSGDKTATEKMRPPTPSSTNANAPTMTQVPPFEPPSRARLSADDLEKQTTQLQSALQAWLKASKLPSTLNSVTIDPRTSVVTIYYAIPLMKGPTETKQGLLYTGFNLVWTADNTNARLKSFVLRGYAFPSDGAREPTLSLLADITPQQADEARSAGDYRAVAKYLSNAWWRGDLDPASL